MLQSSERASKTFSMIDNSLLLLSWMITSATLPRQHGRPCAWRSLDGVWHVSIMKRALTRRGLNATFPTESEPAIWHADGCNKSVAWQN
jgi:hypothetical protein